MTMYQQGTYFERLTKNWLEREGYCVMRSAGSKTCNDLAVFPMKDCKDVGLNIIHPFVIQIKSTVFKDGDDASYFNKWVCGNGELDGFSNQKFNNNYVDKYVFIYDKTKKIKEPFIYKWVIHKWVLVMEDNQSE